MKRLHDPAKCSQKGADYSYDCSLKHKRDIILDQICQSLDSGGLKKCIQSALVSPTGSGSGATSKVYFFFLEEANPKVYLHYHTFISYKPELYMIYFCGE